MKKLFITFFLVLLVPTLSLAADFLPTRLQLTMSETIEYGFDGTTLNIPVTVTGTSARLWFFVFTKDKGDEIGVVQNGHLGWHYVNGIDTCMYMSPPFEFAEGSNTITWTGVDNDGGTIPEGDYTYYVFAYDYMSPPELTISCPPAVSFSKMEQGIYVKELDEDGTPLANPYILDKNIGIVSKWIIGSDPTNTALIETTDLQTVTEWSYQNPHPASCDFNDNSIIYHAESNKDALVLAIRRATWVPNDLATRDTEWGFERGECSGRC